MRMRGWKASPQIFTWATKPAPGGYPRFVPFIISDVEGGSRWQTDGTKLSFLAHEITLGSNLNDQIGQANTNEQILQQYPIPAGLLQVGFTIVSRLRMEKSGTSETCSTKIRLGITGTTSDTVIFSNTAMTTTNRTGATTDTPLYVMSATQLDSLGNSNAFAGGGTSGAVNVPFTIDNISNALILSISAQLSVGVEVATLKNSELGIRR